MINLTRQAKALRNILAALLLVLPALAQAQLAVSVQMESSGGTVIENGEQYVVLGGNPAINFNFTVSAPGIEVISASGNAEFLGQPHTIRTNVSDGTLSIYVLQVILESAPFDRQALTGSITYSYRYTDNETDTEVHTATATLQSLPITAVAYPDVELVSVSQRYLLLGQTATAVYNLIGGRAWSFTGNDNTVVQRSGNTLTVTYTATAADAGRVPTFSYNSTGNSAGEGWNIPGTQIIPVTVYPTPSVSYNAPERATYIPGNLTATLTPQGGDPAGWHYVWSRRDNGGSAVDAGTANTATVAGSAFISYTQSVLTCRARNVAPNGDTLFDQNYDFTFTFYETPSIAITTDERITDLISGSPYTFTSTILGGAPDGWSYRWLVNGSQIATTPSTTYIPETSRTSGSEDVNVQLVADNNAANIVNPYSGEQTRRYRLWGTPQLLSTTDHDLVVFSGTEVYYGAQYVGGVEGGWTYILDNDTQLDQPNNSEIFVNTGSGEQVFTRTISATNEANGERVFSDTQTFTIHVWPVPTATWAQNMPTDVISGSMSTWPFGLVTGGGDPMAWSYYWTVGGSLIGTDATARYDFTYDGEGYSEQVLAVTATNTPANIDAARNVPLSHTFHVWARPELVERTPERYTVFSETPVRMGATFKGGVADNWTYSWYENDILIGDFSNYFTNTSSASDRMMTDRFSLKAVNTCEGVDVFTETCDFTINIWPTPVIEWAGEYPTNVINGVPVQMSTRVSGGDPNAWTYGWSLDGNQAGTQATYTFTPSNTQTSGSLQSTVALHAENAPADIDAPRGFDLNHTFTVWPTPVLAERSQESTTVFSGTPVTMDATFNGGFAEGWTYTWTLDGAEVGSGTSLTVTPENNGSAMTTAVYRLTAVNVCEGTEVFRETYDYTVNTWPAPQMSWLGDIETVLVSGKTVDMTPNCLGGDPNAWSYTWTLDGSTVGNDTHYTFTGVNGQENGSLQASVTLQAVNAPANIDQAREIVLSHTFTVWPEPKMPERSPEEISIFSGRTATLSATFTGGDSEGWEYTWTLNREEVGKEPSLTVSPVNNGTLMSTYVYELTAANTTGKYYYSFNPSYTVVVWPAPEANIGTGYRDNIVAGQTQTYNPVVTGGNPNEWSYSWQLDGVEVATTREYTYRAVNDAEEGSVEHTLSFTATNNSEAVDPLNTYTSTTTHTFRTWAAPAFVGRSSETVTVFSGTQVNINASFRGGVEGGWTYVWTRRDTGEEFPTEIPDYGFITDNTGEGVQNRVYTLTAVNTCEGTEVFRQTYDYNVNIWPVASTAWAAEYPTNVINGIPVQMSTANSGGDPTAWSYTWAENENQSAGTGAQYTFMPVNTQTEGGIGYDVRVTAVNSPAGIDEAYSYQLSHGFVAWPTPALVERTAETVTVFSGTEVTLGATFQGGVEDSWTYTWSRPGEEVASATDTYTFVADNTGEGVQTTVYTLTAVSTCEGTEVFRQTYDYTVNVWPGGTVALAEGLRANMVNGENQTFAATVTGGDPEAWSYQWTVNGENAGTGSTYDFAAVNTAETGTVEYTIVLTATNRPAGIDQELVQTASFTVTVWPTANVTNTMGDVIIFSGETVTLVADITGGYESGWTYQWTNERGDIIGTEASCNVTPNYDGNAIALYQYWLRAINTTDGYVSYDNRVEYNLGVWENAHASFAGTLPSDVISGYDVEMAAAISGGDSSHWTYQWTNNDNVVSTEPNYNFTPENNNANGSLDAVVSLHAVNTPPSIRTPAEFDLSHTFHVWPQPRLDARSPELLRVCSGDPVTLSVTTGGGYAPGWTYEWTYNGNIVGTEASLPVSHTNSSRENESHLYTCHITNVLNGTTYYNNTVYVDVQVYPQALVEVVGLNDADILEGSTNSMSVNYSGGDPDAWSVSWAVDGIEQSKADSFTFTAPTDVPAEGRQCNVSVTVTNRPASETAQPYNRTFVATYTVWPTPRLVRTTPTTPIYVDGETMDIGVYTEGGLPTGWTYLWSRNGTVFDWSASHYDAVAVGPSEGSVTTLYTVIATNSLAGYGYPADFEVTVYARPVAEAGLQDIVAYRGSEVQLHVDCHGGNPEGWAFEWSDGGGSSADASYTVPAAGADGEVYTRTVRVTNSGDGRMWFDRTFTYRITAYSEGTATLVGYTDHDFCGTAAFTMAADVEGGYPDGWTYRWTIDGEEVSTTNTLDVAEYNTGDTRRDVRLRAYVTNRLPNGDTGFVGEYMPDFTIWPQIVAPTDIYISNTAIRQGNSFYVELQPTPQGGYENGWYYDWTENGRAVAGDSYRYQAAANLTTDGNGMATEELNYSVEAGNARRDWFNQRFTAPTMTVYRRPLTPASLQRKGNGTTHTLIVMMAGPTDAELTSLGYHYVFGYTDAQGEDHFFPATDKRYLQIDRSVFDDGRNTLWVMTQWNYSDGSVVTSGRRFLDGNVDEEFDASEYVNGSRGESTIGLVKAGDGIVSDGRYFICQPAAPSTANVKIFTAAGALIRNTDYPRQSSFCETIDVDALAAGMYVVEITVGELHKISKVVVDYK